MAVSDLLEEDALLGPDLPIVNDPMRKATAERAQALPAVMTVAIPDEEDVNSDLITPHSDPGCMFTTDHTISTDQRQQLVDLVDSRPDVFNDFPGLTRAAEHHIDTGDATPFRIPSYRIPKAWEEQVRKEIQDMLDKNIVEPCRSSCASPIVTDGKKDGTLRLCIDYRKLIAITTNDPYQMPRVEDMLE